MSTLRHLLQIDLKKLTNYRTFWVIVGLYFVMLIFSTASGMELLKLLDRLFEDFGGDLNINRIPLYHFPDVWLNLIWFSGWLKIIPAVMVVISVTNEYSYRTLRQNVIDGLSRGEFIISKMLTNFVISFLSVAAIFLIGLVTGMIYSPAIKFNEVITDLEFFFAYFLEIFFFLSYALMLSILIKRSGLTIILVLLSQSIELIITANLDNDFPELVNYFPMRSLWNLIEVPYPRYVFMEIRDYLTFATIAPVVCWIAVFNYVAYYHLKKSDI
jgi:ABC-2 type transport system permease protein